MAKGNRKAVIGWMLFDWASQPFFTIILTFVFLPYFTTAVVGDPVRGQAVWGYTNALSGLVIALLAPILGAIADQGGSRRTWIFGFSIIYVGSCLALWYAVPGMEGYWVILLALSIGMIAAEFSIAFTNAMLPDLVEHDDIGETSGTGWALGFVGGIVALMLVLLFVMANDQGATLLGTAPIAGLDAEAGEDKRAVGPLAALWYLVFILPFFFWTPGRSSRPAGGLKIGAALRELGHTIRTLPERPSFFAYLASSMFYRDALAGIFIFGGVYSRGALNMGAIELGIYGIIALIAGALGTWIGGKLDRRFGPKPVIFGCILVLMLALLIAISLTQTSVFGMAVEEGSRLPIQIYYVVGAMLGAAGGTLGSASRTLLVHQADPERMTEAFGLFALAGKATAFMAPFAIGIATDLTGSQRWGIAPLIVLFAIGLYLLRYVKTEEKDAKTTP